MSAQIGECMAAIVTLAAEVERQRGEIEGLREWLVRIAANREIPPAQLEAVDLAHRMAALELAQQASGDRIRAHMTLGARVRARRQQQREGWWRAAREALGVAGVALSTGVLATLMMVVIG